MINSLLYPVLRQGLQSSGVLFFFFLAMLARIFSTDRLAFRWLPLPSGGHDLKAILPVMMQNNRSEYAFPQAPSTQLACSTAAGNVVPGSIATHTDKPPNKASMRAWMRSQNVPSTEAAPAHFLRRNVVFRISYAAMTDVHPIYCRKQTAMDLIQSIPKTVSRSLS